MSSPTPSPVDFQAHIYTSFLEGSTVDVTLRVRGSWDAIYNLHRVVLIQAGFFRSLFTGGFLESAVKIAGSRGHPDQIEVVFDDTNITRAAFELCIARLYGGGPSLFVDPSIIPTAAQPLTPSFPIPAPRDSVPPGQQPTSPRFLLSILAVAVYLSVPSLASQVLASIMRSVGPFSVVQYLDFAIGKGIGPFQESDLEPAVGLESVAKLVKPSSEDAQSLTGTIELSKKPKNTSQTLHPVEFDETASIALGSASNHASQLDLAVRKVDPAEFSSDSDGTEASINEQAQEHELQFHYGAVSDKIGEAAACWLARWGPDVLVYEQQVVGGTKAPSSLGDWFSGKPSGRRSTLSSAWASPTAGVATTPPPVVPVIWRRGGLDMIWVRALLSSDLLFVKGEKERYDMAKAVVELRRSEGIIDEEEAEWVKVFADGIYYSNMSFDELIYISHDISPSTKRPYVPMSVIQSAHWNQSMLRHQISSRALSSPSSSPTRNRPTKDLGLAATPSEISISLSGHLRELEKDRPYWPVPGDSSERIGDSSSIQGSSMDELFELRSSSPDSPAPRTSRSESTFFGLKTERRIASEIVATNPHAPTQWLPHPPFRFAAEFWDVDMLREKSRLHSQTIWYAGSLFNVYVQLVRKKSQGAQLGVYLHRQSTVDPIPPSSAPSLGERVDKSWRTRAQSQSSPTAPNAPSSPLQYSYSGLPMLASSRSNTPIPGSPSPTSPPGGALPATAPPVSPAQPYRDPRGAVSAYFTISCASATGSSLTRFTSGPDVFSVSQSWGWKSSSLRTEEYLEVGKDGEAFSTLPNGREMSLRVTVVLGIV